METELDLFDETRKLIQALGDRGIEYALVGAIALAVHGAPRATTDIDLLVRRESLEAILEQTRERGFLFEALPMRFPDGIEIRRVSKIIEGETWVISRAALIRMKTWAGREQDIADIRRLEDLDR